MKDWLPAASHRLSRHVIVTRTGRNRVRVRWLAIERGRDLSRDARLPDMIHPEKKVAFRATHRHNDK